MVLLAYILVLLGICACSASNGTASPFDVSYSQHSLYSWEDVVVKSRAGPGAADIVLPERIANGSVALTMKGTKVSELTTYKVFVSMTTISTRVGDVWETIYALLNAVVIPTEIYLFISRDPFLIDEGIKIIPPELLQLVEKQLLRIVYTENTGPHRKLLPLLSRHYNDNDVLIVTIDDDLPITDTTLLALLLMEFFNADEKTVVTLRARRIGICLSKLSQYAAYKSWGLALEGIGRTEMLLLPTGTRGILYRPQFLHPIVFSDVLRQHTETGDDLAFRLSTMANNISVTVGCYDFISREPRCPYNLDWAKKTAGRAPLPIGVPVQELPKTIHFPSEARQSRRLSRSRRSLKRHHHGNSSNNNTQSHTAPAVAAATSPAAPVAVSQFAGQLFEQNRRGKNDQQLLKALGFLSAQGIIPDFGSIVAAHHDEREKKCYANSTTRYCSVYSCQTHIKLK